MYKTILYALVLLGCVSVLSCGDSYEEQKRLNRQERLRLAREDSLALKVATLPTLDCLPLFVAKELNLFDTLHVDVRLKPHEGQIDCDESLRTGKVEGMVSDLVRTQRLQRRGTAIRHVAATNAYWQFISNRLSRITELKQMEDKMVGMARYSVTDMLSDMATDSAKLKTEYVFRVQLNSPNTRLSMLLNNEIDAVIVTEPQATAARLFKNPVLMDTQKRDLRMGVIAFSEKALRDKRRSEQLRLFVKAYDMACDSINKNGLQHYADIIGRYTKAEARTIKALPPMRFPHASAPRKKDLDMASRWLK
ncbi:MAG: ABC transporter substrate-binding protein [Prevotella sp.]|nr:ABC transporter substrate-binding protein [Prevotella sp.]